MRQIVSKMERRLSADDLRIFSLVARAASLASASREMGLPKATVSRRLARLETAVGGRLFDRTAGRLRLTALGESLRAPAEQARLATVAALSAAEAAASEPRGLIRVSSPRLFGQRMIAPELGRLLTEFPRLRAELVLNQEPQDPLRSAFDLSIWVVEPTNPELVVRRVGSVQTGLFLPAQLKAADLDDLNSLGRFTLGAPAAPDWQLVRDSETLMISGPVRAVANDPEAQLAMLLSAGDGIALLPLFLAAPLVREGRLQRVLEDWRTPDVPFYSVMPPGRGAVPAVRAIIDRLHQRLRQADAWVSTEAAD